MGAASLNPHPSLVGVSSSERGGQQRGAGLGGVGGAPQPRPPRFKSAGGISVAAKTNVTYFLLSPRGAEEPGAGHRARRRPPAPPLPRAEGPPRPSHPGGSPGGHGGGGCEQSPPPSGAGYPWDVEWGGHREPEALLPSLGGSGGAPRCCPCPDPPPILSLPQQSSQRRDRPELRRPPSRKSPSAP